jgi:hypothetical protein
LVLKQRAELHIKQSSYELSPAAEKQIESDIMHVLQMDLSKLLVDDVDDIDAEHHAVGNMNKKYDNINSTGKATRNSMVLMMSSIEDLIESSYNMNIDSNNPTSSNSGYHSLNANKITNTGLSIFLYLLLLVLEHLYRILGDVHSKGGVSLSGSDALLVRNEFAAELLYLIRTSMELC